MTLLEPLLPFVTFCTWSYQRILMKTINILATDNCLGSSLLGIIDLIHFCNTFWQVTHPESAEVLFDYQVYSSNGDKLKLSNGLEMPAKAISDYVPADAVFLVSVYAHNKETLLHFLSQMPVFNPIIQQENEQNKIIASYCTGTFGLAQTGILNNGKATTCWWMKSLFNQHFPSVEVTMDELVVTNDNVLTGGATTSYFNVCMQLIEKLSNPIFALQMSKILLLDRHRLSQQPFIDSSFIINKKDELVDKVQDWMMSNYASVISLDGICEIFNVSKRTLIRRFKNACGETPVTYLQKIRVEKAKHFLETSNMPIERIVEKVGYEDTASFRKLFNTHTQLTPKVYRERFSFQNAATDLITAH